MTDRLASLFEHFSLTAQSFRTGPICGQNDVDVSQSFGHLHLIQSGKLEVWHGSQKAYVIAEPTLLFYPRPVARYFVSDARTGADLVCANVYFEGERANPIVSALPNSLCLPITDIPNCQHVITLLFDEANAVNCGRQVVLDRLFEVLLVQLLRELMENGNIKIGMLAGLADKRLRRALVAIHEQPHIDWTVEKLAAQAHMSRTPFANLFRKKVGETPVKYLQHWRLGLVQKWLKNGQSIKLIAEEAGYNSESALSRAFKAQCGISPREWLAQSRKSETWSVLLS